MAIKYDTTFKWGDVFYLKSDPDQAEYNLIGVLLAPGKPSLILRHSGFDEVTVYECETTREPDKEKLLGLNKTTPDENDEED